MKSTLFTIPDQYRKIIFLVLLVVCVVIPDISAPVALFTGLIIALTIGHPFLDMNKKATTLLLQISVVCLGFRMNFEEAMKAGKEGFLFTVGTIALTLLAGYFIGKKLKIDDNTSTLISNGTAICGGSAIAAVAPIVKANGQQISVALGTIFILNSIALFIFPPLGAMLHLTDQQFGTWCAIAIHDTSSVVGAAGKFSSAALQVATTIKLERALWIIPVSLLTAYMKKSTGKIKIPYFIFYFVLAILVATYLPVYIPALATKIGDKTIFGWTSFVGVRGTVGTLFLIGSGLSVQALQQVGWRPIVQGVILWILIGSVSLFVIQHTL